MRPALQTIQPGLKPQSLEQAEMHLVAVWPVRWLPLTGSLQPTRVLQLRRLL